MRILYRKQETLTNEIAFIYNDFMTKLLISIIAINLLGLVLVIPVEFFWWAVPSWLGALFAFAAIGLNLFYIVKCGRGKNKKSKILLTCLTVWASLTMLFFAFCFPYWNSTVYKKNIRKIAKDYDYQLSQKEALQDLAYAYRQLNRVHPAMLDKKGEEFKKVKAAYDSEVQKINGKESLSVVELNQHVERVFSVLEDAHTYARANYQEPLYMKYLDKTKHEGFEFVEVNGIPYKELLQQKKDLFSYESELWAIKDLGDFSICYQWLIYLGYDMEKGITYTLEKEDDQGLLVREYLTATKDDFLSYKDYLEYNKEYRQQKEEASAESQQAPSFCSYEIDREHNLAILTLTSCKNNAEYKKCLNDMFTKVKENNIGNVAVDVRNNGGGSSLVINNFIRYLDTDGYYEPTCSSRLGPFLVKSGSGYIKNNKIRDLLFTGNVYVLTSVRSFSSAMMFPQMIKDNGLGKVIGQAPANNPNGYGDVVHFNMPNSNIFMQISYKKFHRVNQNTSEKYVEPDYPCESEEAIEELYKYCGK